MNNDEKICAICLNIVNESNNLFQCNHYDFHINCIKNLSSCPMCRANLKPSENCILIYDENHRKLAEQYRSTNELIMTIKIIQSMKEYKNGDILYCPGSPCK